MNSWESSAQTLSVKTEEKEIDLDKYKPGTFVYVWTTREDDDGQDVVHLQHSLISYLEVSWNSFAAIAVTAHFNNRYATNYKRYEEDLLDESIVGDGECFLTEEDALADIKLKGYDHLPIKKIYLTYPPQTKDFTKKYFKECTKKYSEIDKYYGNFEI